MHFLLKSCPLIRHVSSTLFTVQRIVVRKFPQYLQYLAIYGSHVITGSLPRELAILVTTMGLCPFGNSLWRIFQTSHTWLGNEPAGCSTLCHESLASKYNQDCEDAGCFRLGGPTLPGDHPVQCPVHQRGLFYTNNTRRPDCSLHQMGLFFTTNTRRT